MSFGKKTIEKSHEIQKNQLLRKSATEHNGPKISFSATVFELWSDLPFHYDPIQLGLRAVAFSHFLSSYPRYHLVPCFITGQLHIEVIMNDTKYLHIHCHQIQIITLYEILKRPFPSFPYINSIQ